MSRKKIKRRLKDLCLNERFSVRLEMEKKGGIFEKEIRKVLYVTERLAERNSSQSRGSNLVYQVNAFL